MSEVVREGRTYRLNKVVIDLSMATACSLTFTTSKDGEPLGSYQMTVSGDEFGKILSTLDSQACANLISRLDGVPVAKSADLKQAENNFISFCQLLGFSGKATTAEVEAVCTTMKANGQVMEAIEAAIKGLALINNVTQNGGNWVGIEWHDDV